ncbi:hypothetical protein BD311DRAFT_759970 [Dichomitus squalens]|uniref:Uncharacterized protein n=1 Tax=Dichomitus squalens TaxID=114155 RepID=A0A4Q9MKR0_9APHY|nr:hypothetical protein BD311DRAFT_759970 [Dichomitus squalens]
MLKMVKVRRVPAMPGQPYSSSSSDGYGYLVRARRPLWWTSRPHEHRCSPEKLHNSRISFRCCHPRRSPAER